MINIAVADDHPIFRAGIKQIIDDEADMNVCFQASTGQELLHYISKENADIIILDISLPDKNGLDIVKEINIMKPKIPILILSMYSEEIYALRAAKAGASGYLNKEGAPEKLIDALSFISQGGKYFSNKVTATITEYLIKSRNDLKPHELLSDREFEVMCSLAEGKSVSEIASEKFLSVKTISTYRKRILEKMNMKSNSEIIRYCIDNALIN